MHSAGSEIPWSEIDGFVRRLVSEDLGKRRAANLIRGIASQLAAVEACEDLANAAQEVQRMLVRAWENRWERERGAASASATTNPMVESVLNAALDARTT